MYFAAPPTLDMKSSLIHKTQYIICKKRFIYHKRNTQAEINTCTFSPLTQYLKSTTKNKKHTDSPPDHRHGDTKLATDFLSQSSACPQLQNIIPWGSLFIPAFIIWPPDFFLWPLLELGMMFPLTHYLYNFYASTTSKLKCSCSCSFIYNSSPRTLPSWKRSLPLMSRVEKVCQKLCFFLVVSSVG